MEPMSPDLWYTLEDSPTSSHQEDLEQKSKRLGFAGLATSANQNTEGKKIRKGEKKNREMMTMLS